MNKPAVIRLGLAAFGVGAALVAAIGPAEPVRAQNAQPIQIGDTLITSETLDYDLAKKQYIFTGKVDLVSKTSHMTSDKMTVQMNEDNEMQWSRCEGNVVVDRKDPEAGTKMTGWGKLLNYYEIEQKADLQGGIVIHQESPRLAKPAIITGDHVDMDLKTHENIVYRTKDQQAKAHVEPKGNPPAAGQPTPESPEPIDLIGDRIQMNSETQQYIATGKPMMIKPSAKLQARIIRFTVDQQTSDVKVAYADDNVIYDGTSQQGSVVHSTGDRGIYNKGENQMNMDGNVHATVLDPGQEKPSVYQGDHFVYNTETGARKLWGNARVQVPQSPKKATPASIDTTGKAQPATAPGGTGNNK